MSLPPCAECGFDAAEVPNEQLAEALRDLLNEASRQLRSTAGDSAVRARSGGWSAIEYVAHLRDVCTLFERRIRQLVETEDQELEVVDHDAAVVAGRYNELDPGAVADDLDRAGARLADVIRSLDGDAWRRIGRKAGEERTVLEIAQRAVHEATHHLLDVRRLLADRVSTPHPGDGLT